MNTRGARLAYVSSGRRARLLVGRFSRVPGRPPRHGGGRARRRCRESCRARTVALDDHELAAVRLALAAQERFEELAQTWRKRDTDLGLGIGIEAGYATVGRIGFEGRYDYAALGSVTNLTSRLSTHAAAGQTLVGPRVFAAVEEAVLTEPVGGLDLKGFGRPIPAYEVRGLRTAE
jgi:class 3 adenylate cyclase